MISNSNDYLVATILLSLSSLMASSSSSSSSSSSTSSSNKTTGKKRKRIREEDMPFKKVGENGVDTYHCKHCGQYLEGECFAPSSLEGRIRRCRQCAKARQNPPICQGCGLKQANYGVEKRTHCASCKTDGMVDLVNKMCVKCKKIRASYGVEGGKMICCSGCKEPGMVDLKHKMCVKCQKVLACFAKEGEKASHCGSCKLPGMVNVHNPRCDEEGCNKFAQGRGPKPSKCKQHGGGHRCITDNCDDLVYANDKEKKYCHKCYCLEHNITPTCQKVRETHFDELIQSLFLTLGKAVVYNKMYVIKKQ